MELKYATKRRFPQIITDLKSHDNKGFIPHLGNKLSFIINDTIDILDG
jgi:hypothetical protein